MAVGEIVGNTSLMMPAASDEDRSSQRKPSIEGADNLAKDILSHSHLPSGATPLYTPGATPLYNWRDEVKRLDPELYIHLEQEFPNDLPWGIFKYVNGDIYEGKWKNCKRHGRGKYTTAAGDVYEGDWKEDQADGMGTCTYARGDKYQGSFTSGMMDGWGTYTFPDGASYAGNWVKNKWHGFGTLTYPSGDRCSGRFSDNTVKVAYVYYKNGDVYNGSWGIEEKRHGKGSCDYSNGEKYSGEWNNDRKHGYGTYRWPNGDYYDGYWKDDKMHGIGTFKTPTHRYEGKFENGQKHGEGTHWNFWGSASKQEWIHGTQARRF